MLRELKPIPTGPVIYTVPTPMGKTAGMSGDGRLHMVCVQVQGDGIDNVAYALRYLDPSGAPIATFPDWVAFGTSTINPGRTGTLTWTSEPMFQNASGATYPVGSEATVYLAQGQPGGFRWLPAGYSAEIFSLAVWNPGFTVVSVVVEDYGQAAEGDEYEQAGRAAPIGDFFLIPDAGE